MKRIFLILPILLITIQCSLFEEDDVPELDSAEIYETGDATYPAIAVDETQTIFGFSQTLDNIFVQLPEGDQWIINLNNEKYPSSMYVKKGTDEFLILFSEFEDDYSSVAVINQETQEIQNFYDIEFNGISDLSKSSSIFSSINNNLKSGSKVTTNNIETWWGTYGEAVKKMVGPVLGGIGCGVSAIAAVGTGGWATPIAVLSCGSFASSISGDIVGKSSDAGGALFKGGAVVGKYGEMVLKCASANWGTCTIAIAGEIGAIKNLMDYGISKADANKIKEHLTTYMKTGGLAGTWIGNEMQIPTGSSNSEYYFGLNSGQLTLNISQSEGGNSINSGIEMDFNYTTKNKNKLTITMQRVTMVTTTLVNGNSYSDSQGPFSWAEFVSLGQNQTGYANQTTEINYTLKDNANTLEFSNGEIYNRK